MKTVEDIGHSTLMRKLIASNPRMCTVQLWMHKSPFIAPLRNIIIFRNSWLNVSFKHLESFSVVFVALVTVQIDTIFYCSSYISEDMYRTCFMVAILEKKTVFLLVISIHKSTLCRIIYYDRRTVSNKFGALITRVTNFT